MTIRLKEGVAVQGLRTEMLLGLMIALGVYQEYGYDLVVTSLLDGKHSRTSLHYSGCGADLRTRHMQEAHKQLIADEINDRCGTDYDVVLESDHIHMEFQPKR
jgi:hypothetical protein